MGLNFYYYDGLQPKMSAGMIKLHECTYKDHLWGAFISNQSLEVLSENSLDLLNDFWYSCKIMHGKCFHVCMSILFATTWSRLSHIDYCKFYQIKMATKEEVSIVVDWCYFWFLFLCSSGKIHFALFQVGFALSEFFFYLHLLPVTLIIPIPMIVESY